MNTDNDIPDLDALDAATDAEMMRSEAVAIFDDELVPLDPSETKIAHLRDIFMPIVVENEDDLVGYKHARKALTTMVKLRTHLNKLRLNGGSAARSFITKLNERAGALQAQMDPIEAHLKAQTDIVRLAQERKLAEQKAAIEAAAKKQLDDRMAMLNSIMPAAWIPSTVAAYTEDEFHTLLQNAHSLARDARERNEREAEERERRAEQAAQDEAARLERQAKAERDRELYETRSAALRQYQAWQPPDTLITLSPLAWDRTLHEAKRHWTARQAEETAQRLDAKAALDDITARARALQQAEADLERRADAIAQKEAAERQAEEKREQERQDAERKLKALREKLARDEQLAREATDREQIAAVATQLLNLKLPNPDDFTNLDLFETMKSTLSDTYNALLEIGT